MRRIEFSEMTNRLHRNAMSAASVIIAITYFDISISKISNSGIDFSLTTPVVLVSLSVLLLYHVVAFGIRAFEEYREWDIRLTESQSASISSQITGLAPAMLDASNVLARIVANGGSIRHNNQDVITEMDAHLLKALANAADTYAKRFKNFPKITRLRFWGWDIGVTCIVSLFAIVAAGRSLCS